MYEKIGDKIKIVAVVVTVLGVVGSIVYGIILMANELAGLGFLILVLGSLFFWLASFPLYGLGELVNRCISIDEKLEVNYATQNVYPQNTTQATIAA
ncbi:MAG: hypothetical protein ACERKO_12830, partial [Acetanaerobacterium sp.]